MAGAPCSSSSATEPPGVLPGDTSSVRAALPSAVGDGSCRGPTGKLAWSGRYNWKGSWAGCRVGHARASARTTGIVACPRPAPCRRMSIPSQPYTKWGYRQRYTVPVSCREARVGEMPSSLTRGRYPTVGRRPMSLDPSPRNVLRRCLCRHARNTTGLKDGTMNIQQIRKSDRYHHNPIRQS